MRNRVRRSTVLLFLMGFLLAGASAASTFVQPVLAQTCTGGDPSTFSLTPSVVSNTASTTVVVASTTYNFQANPTSVNLSGYGVLSSTATAPQILDVDIPAGIAPGTYQLQVTSTPPGCVSLGLTIVGGTSTPLPTAYVRPLVVVHSYGPSSSPLHPGQTFALEVNIINTGQLPAHSIIVTFFPGDFEPRETGGVRSEGTLQPGEIRKIIQVFTAKDDLDTGLAILDAEIAYVDSSGTAYTETVRLTLDIVKPGASGPGATRTPTPTATSVARPLLVIEDYDIDIEQIQPGSTFTLTMVARNLGTAEARNLSLIIGGGSASSGGGGDTDGTPGGDSGGGGGISGGSSELTNFAPLGSSNVLFLGNVPAGNTVEATITLITSATLTPNLYSLRMSFVYVDPAGRTYGDDQIITLLVFRPPDVAISFYTQPFCFVEQPCNLPIQLLNLAREQAVLGEMVVSAENTEPLNDRTIIGALDPGFPFTFDAQLIPHQAGPMDVLVTISYRDDFNQEQTLTETLTVPVEEGGGFPPEGEGGIDSGQFPGEGEPPFEEPGVGREETVWDMIVRFVLGLLGLDSAPPQPDTGEQFFPPEGMPSEEGFPVEEGIPAPVEIRPGP